MAQSTANLKAVGLNYSPNQLSLPDGSLTQADNIIIRRDNVVESRRGMRRYNEPIGLTTDLPKQLIEYKDRVIEHYSNKLAFDTGVLDIDQRAIFANFDGTYSETQAGLRIKYIEANKNLYFTTSDGIKKMSAVTAADFTTQAGFIQNAGAVKALDITAELDITQGLLSGFLPPDSTVAYRAVWGYKDANQNLLLGSPSNRAVVFNFLTDNIAMDINQLTIELDNLNQTGSLITDGNYADSFYTPVNSEAFVLQNNILSLANKLDNDILLADVSGTPPLVISSVELTNNIVTITFSSGDPTQYLVLNDNIEITDLDGAFVDINGIHTLDLSPTSSTISFTFTHADIASGSPTSGTIYSYNYRHITNTGDALFPTPLNDVVFSTPPTNGEISIIENTLLRIVDKLKQSPVGIISTPLLTEYILPYTLTQSANTKVFITIPEDITASYFVQVYRSRIFTATSTQTLGGSGGLSVSADDEMRLVFEHFPTAAEVTAGIVEFDDSFPDALVQNNTNLYTNPETGEGINQSNEPPPFATDINVFKNVTFYSNTRTKHIIPVFQLLGLSNIVSGDKITITNSTQSDTYTFVSGVQEITDITFTDGASLVSGDYYILYSASDDRKYVFWQRVDGSGSQPVVSDDSTYVVVDVLSTDTANQIAYKNKSEINVQIFDFTAEDNTLPTIRITNIGEGLTTDADAGTSPFTVSVVQQGNGENATLKQVLLSSLVSAAQAIEQTAQSLVRVINKQTNSAVAAYYVSGDTTPPGQITLQAKNLSIDPFYVLGSSEGIGSSFNPNISPDFTNITNIAIGNPSIITFSSPHGLQNGDKIIISGSNSTPIIDGLHTITRIDATHVSVPINVTVVGTSAVWSLPSDTAISTNDQKPNRIYYSKLNQPEAVPLLNFFDVSAQDKEILRIFPLRDTLFVFKEDGTYRVSGEIAPFVTSLLDSSCIVIAPDTVAVSNNVVYAWTSKGISPITETGASSEISRPIDTEILRLSSNFYPNFSTLTWGIGYDSDNSYIVYTNTDPEDISATLGFRYCTLTNTWTNITRAQTCGVIIPSLDLLFLGSGIDNTIDRERKLYLRQDYADDDFKINLGANALLNPLVLQFTSVDGIVEGDSITQEQTLTIYDFNKILDQLDSDPTLQTNYFSTLEAASGDNMRNKIVSLAAKLDADPGTNFKNYSDLIANKSGTISSNSISANTQITTSAPHKLVPGRIVTIAGSENGSIPSIIGTHEVSNTGTFGSSTTFRIDVAVTTEGGTGLTFNTSQNLNSFEDIKACFNALVNNLNNDSGVTFNSYQLINDITLFEAVVLSIDVVKKRITLNLPLQWIIGPMTIYESIGCEWTYAPAVFGDPLSTKHLFDTTIMFRDRAITEFTAAFSSDLFPAFTEIKFKGQGNGIFGHYGAPGFGYGTTFGGSGNSAPFRTYVPMNHQRCRYVNLKITHNVARESWALYGVTITGNTSVSFRGYR